MCNNDCNQGRTCSCAGSCAAPTKQYDAVVAEGAICVSFIIGAIVGAGVVAFLLNIS